MRILYAEDNNNLAFLLMDLLRKSFPDVVIDYFNNGLEAYNSFLIREYDLVISDFNMPELDGLSLAEKIKALKPSILICIHTATSIEYLKSNSKFKFIDHIFDKMDIFDLIDLLKSFGGLNEYRS